MDQTVALAVIHCKQTEDTNAALAAYVMPDEEVSMRKDEHPEEVERALLALDKARSA